MINARLEKILTDLKNGANITEIDLTSYMIGDEGVVALAEALKTNTTVTKLNLKGNTNISFDKYKVLGELLKTNNTVTWLGLEGCWANDDTEGEWGFKAILMGLNQNKNSKLTSIDLTWSMLDNGRGYSMLHLLSENTTLTDLKIQTGNELSPTTLKKIEKWIERNRTPKAEINAHLERILTDLKSGANITEIDLTSYRIADEGLEALAEALKTNTTVTKLNLKGNTNISSDKCKVLGELFKTNNTIIWLGLEGCWDWNNKEGEIALENLLTGLNQNKNSKLTSIDLSWNKLDDKQGHKMLDLLSENTTITDVKIRVGNQLTPATLEKIKAWTDRNRSEQASTQVGMNIIYGAKKKSDQITPLYTALGVPVNNIMKPPNTALGVPVTNIMKPPI